MTQRITIQSSGQACQVTAKFAAKLPLKKKRTTRPETIPKSSGNGKGSYAFFMFFSGFGLESSSPWYTHISGLQTAYLQCVDH